MSPFQYCCWFILRGAGGRGNNFWMQCFYHTCRLLISIISLPWDLYILTDKCYIIYHHRSIIDSEWCQWKNNLIPTFGVLRTRVHPIKAHPIKLCKISIIQTNFHKLGTFGNLKVLAFQNSHLLLDPAIFSDFISSLARKTMIFECKIPPCICRPIWAKI